MHRKASEMAATDALSSEEWLAAGRLSLGLSDDADLQLLEVNAKPAAGEGELEGFLGETTPVALRVREGTDGEARTVALFLKVVPKGNAAREALAEGTRAFDKESRFFLLLERLLPRLRNGVPAPWGARCVLAQPRLLLFEDLCAQGFRTLGMRSTLDFPHCAAALDAVARLHAASLAMEETDRRSRGINPYQLGKRFPDATVEVFFTDQLSNHLSKFFVVGLASMKTIVSLMPEYKDSPRYEEILKKIDDLPRIAYEVAKPSEKYRNVICHGDLWVNNIMFKYSSWGQVAEARLVDFQLTRYTPPALDVQMLLFLSMRKELRDAHAKELCDSYYAALEQALDAVGLKASELLPRKEFDASCRRGAAFGRIVPATYLPCDLLPADIMRELMASSDNFERFLLEDRSAFVRDVFGRNTEYRERMREVIGELVEGLLLADEGPF